MKLSRFVVLFAIGFLTACSNGINIPLINPQPKAETQTIVDDAKLGGSIGSGMDEFDQNKMFRALDAALGKSTEWVSTKNGTKYTVTPVERVKVNNNPICRVYTVVAVSKSGNERKFNGTACVTDDGSWHVVQ